MGALNLSKIIEKLRHELDACSKSMSASKGCEIVSVSLSIVRSALVVIVVSGCKNLFILNPTSVAVKYVLLPSDPLDRKGLNTMGFTQVPQETVLIWLFYHYHIIHSKHGATLGFEWDLR